ncbi:MAG: Gfo/Idh/MocA family oxidoreductase [Bacteroidetes bacterium]|nr:Gfo/Idh/MocA family oxidoreductase [Bacteroidota bacterium]
MNALIIGSGRMGIRHAQGLETVGEVENIYLTDLKEEKLAEARQELGESSKFHFESMDKIKTGNRNFEVVIIASTAGARLESCIMAVEANCEYLLLEKPLGQSMDQVDEIKEYIAGTAMKTAVNLNMRLYADFIRLQKDLLSMPQFEGEKILTINTGTIGISANAVHYFDLIKFLLNAQRIEMIHAEIDSREIPSGRGEEFKDFGGICDLKYYGEDDNLVGRVYLSINPVSTVFGGWDIIGSNARITINEPTQERVDYIRKVDSQMPVYRYGAEYEPPKVTKFESPLLGDLTALWLERSLKGEKILPDLDESYRAHELMFEWLSKSEKYNGSFPIA